MKLKIFIQVLLVLHFPSHQTLSKSSSYEPRDNGRENSIFVPEIILIINIRGLVVGDVGVGSKGYFNWCILQRFSASVSQL